MDWQTIDTAPRDKPLLGWSQYEGVFRMVSRSAGGWWLDGTDADNAHDLSSDLITVYPTHWMPLPPPPTEPRTE